MSGSIADVLSGNARWTLINGDCLEIMPVLPDRCVAHVVTDPPYEAAAHTQQRRVKAASTDGTRSRWGGGWTDAFAVRPLSFAPISEAERRSAAAEFARLANRWVVTFCQVEAAMRWAECLTEAGASIRRVGVWVKPDAMPQFTGDRPGMGYESIVFAHAKGRSRWNGGGRVGVFTHNKNGRDGGPNDHPTQKPLSLMLELVSLFTDPAEIVLDPFAGSGTTGVACLRLGRRFIGVEKDATYAQAAWDRLAAESRGQTLRQFRAGQAVLPFAE